MKGEAVGIGGRGEGVVGRASMTRWTTEMSLGHSKCDGIPPDGFKQGVVWSNE